MALLTTFAVIAIFTAPPAQASYVGNNYLRNWGSGLCLTAYTSSSGSDGVFATNCVPQNSSNKLQTWEPEYQYNDGNDVVQLRNIQYNKCLYGWYDGNSRMWLALSPCSTANDYEFFEAVPAYSGASWSQVRFKWVSEPSWSQCIENDAGQYVNFHGCNWDIAYGLQQWKLGY